MADTEIRALERAAAQGEPGARERLYVARARVTRETAPCSQCGGVHDLADLGLGEGTGTGSRHDVCPSCREALAEEADARRDLDEDA